MRGLVSVLALTACLAVPTLASAQDAAPEVAVQPAADRGDPWQGFNRSMFGIHQGIDGAVLEPVARGYRAVTPRPVRTGVLNFLRNLRGPVIFANDVLQGEVNRAGTTAGRFAINTTIGVAGIFDPATSMGLPRHDEDFGQTLAVWGVPSGPYVFVPLMGPTTVRDGAGSIVDIVFDPMTWANLDDAGTAYATRAVVTGVAQREVLLDPIASMEAQGGDVYLTYRTTYEVAREAAIENGRTDAEDSPDFEDIDEEPAINAPDDGATAEAIEPQADQTHEVENSVVFTEALTLPTSMKD